MCKAAKVKKPSVCIIHLHRVIRSSKHNQQISFKNINAFAHLFDNKDEITLCQNSRHTGSLVILFKLPEEVFN